MKRVKFTPVSNSKLLSVFARYRGPQQEAAPVSETREELMQNAQSASAPVSSPPPANNSDHSDHSAQPGSERINVKVSKNLPRARRMVFSTGRRLFMPAQVKEIKIRFVLNK